eukprot:6212248-Pleurochrysis_carterae.AAC.4
MQSRVGLRWRHALQLVRADLRWRHRVHLVPRHGVRRWKCRRRTGSSIAHRTTCCCPSRVCGQTALTLMGAERLHDLHAARCHGSVCRVVGMLDARPHAASGGGFEGTCGWEARSRQTHRNRCRKLRAR